MLEIDNLCAGYSDIDILKGLTLSIKKGEIHSIMGPNGAGKSTLCNILAGHPSYKVRKGSIRYNNADLLEMEPEKRALNGLFLGYQYPVEIPGVNNAEFLRLAYNSKMRHEDKEELDPLDFDEIMDKKMEYLGIDSKYKERYVNCGFSGGEKKRNEILQMAVLEPKLAILDEIDSGLDIDAMKIVATGIKKLANENNSLLIITHYQRLLDYITPDYVHVLSQGKIVKTGDKSLAIELEKRGYDFLQENK